jgi:hypothetical protein
VYVVIRFWKPYTETGYNILIHGLIHILYYIRVIIIFYTISIMLAAAEGALEPSESPSAASVDAVEKYRGKNAEKNVVFIAKKRENRM